MDRDPSQARGPSRAGGGSGSGAGSGGALPDQGSKAAPGAVGREPDLPRTASEVLARGREWLAARGFDEARLEVELLVAHALGLTRLGLFLELERPVDAEEVALARELLVRRARHEPVAYLVGQREFYGRPFQVTPAVLIPRPETELIVDRARELCGARRADSAVEPEPDPAGPDPGASPRAWRIADLGTGSGCLAVTLALEIAGARVCASDTSEAALAVARQNAATLGAEVVFVAGDGPEALAEHAPFDVLVANPPYVDPAVRDTLAPEVREHEPALALFAPPGDPDHWIRRILDAGLPLLAPGGTALIELGADQAERALSLARERGLAARVLDDLAGLPRIFEVVVGGH